MKNAIYAIGRLENDYVLEWVEYHLNIGFDKIYIYDNNYDGEEYFEDVLEDYIKKGKVQIINARNIFNYQKNSYNISIQEYCYKYDWNAFIDIDEFVTIKGYNNIKEYLSQDKFNEADVIIMNWKLYGDSNKIKKEQGNVVDRFTQPLSTNKIITYNFPENLHIKSIINGKSKYLKDMYFESNPHNINTKTKEAFLNIKCLNGIGEKVKKFNTPFSEKIIHDGLYLRHYSTKTIEEFIKIKLKRGFCEGRLNMSLDWFWKRNDKTDEKIEFANKLIKELK